MAKTDARSINWNCAESVVHVSHASSSANSILIVPSSCAGDSHTINAELTNVLSVGDALPKPHARPASEKCEPTIRTSEPPAEIPKDGVA